MTARIIYVGPNACGALMDAKQGKVVPYVRCYVVTVSKELAKELLKNNPAHWVAEKEN